MKGLIAFYFLGSIISDGNFEGSTDIKIYTAGANLADTIRCKKPK